MSEGRSKRIREARIWWKDQHFSDGDHILKAYRIHFHVDRVCAMRDLLQMGVLDPETKEAFKGALLKREEKMAKKRERAARRAAEKKKGRSSGRTYEEWQDENFFFIAGYTSGGAPYGITWEEERRIEEEEEMEKRERDRMNDPGYLEYLAGSMEEDIPEDTDLPFQ